VFPRLRVVYVVASGQGGSGVPWRWTEQRPPPILSCSGVNGGYKEYNDVVSRCVKYWKPEIVKSPRGRAVAECRGGGLDSDLPHPELFRRRQRVRRRR